VCCTSSRNRSACSHDFQRLSQRLPSLAPPAHSSKSGVFDLFSRWVLTFLNAFARASTFSATFGASVHLLDPFAWLPMRFDSSMYHVVLAALCINCVCSNIFGLLQHRSIIRHGLQWRTNWTREDQNMYLGHGVAKRLMWGPLKGIGTFTYLVIQVLIFWPPSISRQIFPVRHEHSEPHHSPPSIAKYLLTASCVWFGNVNVMLRCFSHTSCSPSCASW